MNIIKTKVEDVVILEPKVFGDHRGYFMESYNKDVFEKLGLNLDFIQDNQSLSVPVGTLRGLHFQLNPKAQTKLVRCITGAIYDVAVDIRKGSPTYGAWIGVILSEHNKRQLLVPQGFAHGFCTLVPDTTVAYKVDEYYSPEHDAGIIWNDPTLGIDWPTANPILSDKDAKLPVLAEINHNFVYDK
ncbi:dTDP-4-dehydrorhamnose 3,5-epimerase [Bacillus sp. DJP31]|uniref:dTDP-4-dehydrorhamnose 3,5-epimerase n=1 Tax=Bacillus sp. DJP31 TaxID=3409789 RepID=UPI003BB60932